MSAPILHVRDLRLRRGPRTILSGITFSVDRGGLVALMGPSGSGKTTVLRAIAGLEPFDAGTIVVDEVTLGPGRASAGALRQLRRHVGFVFQFHHLFEHLTVLENVTLAPVHVRKTPPDAARARAMDLLAQLGVELRARALPRELSGGEAQRVAIARALAVDPPLLMMDEPTASLDPGRRTELGELLRRLTGERRTIFVSTHDEAFAREWSTGILRVGNGEIGPLEERP